MIVNFSFGRLVALLLVLQSLACVSLADEKGSQLRSANLGPTVWEIGLDCGQVNEQLVEHFETVIDNLNSDFEHSLEESVSRYAARFGGLANSQRLQVMNELRQSRLNQIEILQEYADRGLFPLNKEFGSAAKPIFVDDQGTHCAVGYLMHRSGHDDLVQRVVENNNFVLIEDINNDSALDWIAKSGLTVAEAAMIQPAYAPPQFDATLVDFSDPTFEVSIDGMAVSNLNVRIASFSSSESNLDMLLADAIFELDVFGVPYPFPGSFGVALECGIFASKDIYYFPEFPTWVFVGDPGAKCLELVENGDNVLAHRIQYSVSDSLEVVRAANISITPFFNFNFSSYRIATFVTDSNGMSVGEGFLDAERFLDADVTFDIMESQFVVTTYVVEPNADQFDGTFSSLFNEFQREDGPAVFGDMNKDRSVDLLDVALFVDAITNFEYDAAADFNQDALNDILDVAPFVQVLVGS